MRRTLKNDSRIDYSTFSSFNNEGSLNMSQDLENLAPYIRNNKYNHLNKYQRSMSFDSIYKGPSQSRHSKAVKGQVFKDSRYSLN